MPFFGLVLIFCGLGHQVWWSSRTDNTFTGHTSSVILDRQGWQMASLVDFEKIKSRIFGNFPEILKLVYF
jgi:hypothetical protein